MVSDYIDPDLGSWRLDRLRAAVIYEEMEAITVIPKSINGNNDQLVWHFSNSGAKAYELLGYGRETSDRDWVHRMPPSSLDDFMIYSHYPKGKTFHLESSA